MDSKVPLVQIRMSAEGIVLVLEGDDLAEKLQLFMAQHRERFEYDEVMGLLAREWFRNRTNTAHVELDRSQSYWHQLGAAVLLLSAEVAWRLNGIKMFQEDEAE